MQDAIDGHPSLPPSTPSPNNAETSPITVSAIVLALEGVAAFLQSDQASMLIPNRADGQIDFSLIAPATNDFTMAEIMKSIAANPLKFDLDQHQCNMDDLSMNTKNHEKVKG